MFSLTFAGLLSTPAPSAIYVGIASVALFAIVGVMVGPEYENMNEFSKDNMNKPKN